ncbi:hypothetical protein QBC40DRAFT_336768 [Triangularia verruculosa]|uniref:Secreted protein n=1 Tax=Triangularia verruculosa TaxID=2587418 RepID=A0AAN6XPR3_9PEZI|nr:hypothetical protein QBC40DRAFT_336768 [Triangularia verruculosa]
MHSPTVVLLAGAMMLVTVGAQLPAPPILPIPRPFPTPINQPSASYSNPTTPPPGRNNIEQLEAISTLRKPGFATPSGPWKSLASPYTSGRYQQVLERAPQDCASQTSHLKDLAAQQPVFPPELQALAQKHKVWFSACGPTFENAIDPSFDPQAFTPAFQAWQDTLATNLRRLMNACHNSQETVDAIARDPCLRDLLAQAPVIPLGPLPESEQATFTTLLTIEIPDPTTPPADPVTVTEMSTAWLTATMVVEENRTVVVDQPKKQSESAQGVVLSIAALLTGMLAGSFVFAL